MYIFHGQVAMGHLSLFVPSFPLSIITPPLRHTDIHSSTAKAEWIEYKQLG
jgi:hypothetical protein